MGWETVDDAIHDMRNALKCSNCVGFQISNRKPNNIEEDAANKMGIPWVYTNGVWAWSNPNLRN